jgi:hypothetical protein
MENNIKLHMGFIGTPYTYETKGAPIRSAKIEEARKRKRGFSRTMTADKLAGILERKYEIVQVFNEIYENEITEMIHNGFREVAEHMISNRKTGTTTIGMKRLMKPYTDKIQEMFRTFIDNEEMNGLVEGVPTAVSVTGRGGWKWRRKPGPSFVASGIYRASFRAWVE